MTAWGIFFDSPLTFADGVRIQNEIHKARLADRIPDPSFSSNIAPR